FLSLFFCDDTATTVIYTLSLHDALPIFERVIEGFSKGFAICAPRVRHCDLFDLGVACSRGQQGGRSDRYASGCLQHVATRKHHKDRKSTRLNSSHVKISYAVFCLKKKKK